MPPIPMRMQFCVGVGSLEVVGIRISSHHPQLSTNDVLPQCITVIIGVHFSVQETSSVGMWV